MSASEVSISTNSSVEVALVHMKLATWNPYEHLCGGDGFTNCTFSPVFWVPPFWEFMGLLIN